MKRYEKNASGIQQEVSAANRVEMALVRARWRNRGFLNKTEPIFRAYPDGTISFVNAAFCRMTGMKEKDILGSSFLTFVSHRDMNRALALIKELSPANPEKAMKLTVHANDRTYYMNWIGRAVFDSEGILIEYQGIGRDITARKRAEDALRESEQTGKAILNAITETIILMDTSGFVLDLNQIAAEQFGEEPFQIIGKCIYSFMPPDLAASRRNQAGKAISTGKMVRFDDQRDGRWFSNSVYPIFNDRGVVYRLVVFGKDISDRKRAMEYLCRAKQELELTVRQRTAELAESNKSLLSEIEERKKTEERLRNARNELRAIASEIALAEERSRKQIAANLHDTVAQTLAAAKLRSEVLREHVSKSGNECFAEMQNFLHESIIQARHIINEISTPVLHELGFLPALEELTELITSSSGINIGFQAKKMAEPLPHDLQILLFQVTRELLINVAKHSQASEAGVYVTSYPREICIWVEDNGIGFDGKINYKASATGGFGLLSVYERLRYVGGRISIHSSPGKGTRVKVTAPV